MTNQEIAEVLREMAVFYGMEGVQFKPRAYELAADSVAIHPEPLAELYKREGRAGFREVSGVGEGIGKHIESLLKKKTFPELSAFRKQYPVHVRELTSLEGVGPKTVRALYEQLGVRNLEDLQRAARSHKLGKLKGFGVRSEEKIADAVVRHQSASGRKLLGEILPLAKQFEEQLRAIPGVKRVMVTGSVRRRQETIGDLDFIVTTSKPDEVMDAYLKFPEVESEVARGETLLTVRLQNGMHSDIRLIPDVSYGAAIQYFTGDKQHNIVIRTLAGKKGLMLNEFGLWRGKKNIASKTEEEIYNKLGFDVMPPEIRTASGELEAAKAHRLPKLVDYDAVRGDLQVQTDWTDGRASIREMAEAAMKLGREYIAITDHTKALAMTGGLDAKKLAAQGKEIDAINKQLAGSRIKSGMTHFRILKGSECDILESGKLDLPDAALEKLDVVGASIHSHFHLSRAAQTKRMLRAMENPHVDMIFHPTGRRIGRRAELDYDMETVLKAARVTGTAMEVNSSPDRMDLRDVYVRLAVKLGVKLVVNTDAHAPQELAWMELGIGTARRGWAEAPDILNTRPLEKLLAWFQTPKGKRK